MRRTRAQTQHHREELAKSREKEAAAATAAVAATTPSIAKVETADDSRRLNSRSRITSSRVARSKPCAAAVVAAAANKAQANATAADSDDNEQSDDDKQQEQEEDDEEDEEEEEDEKSGGGGGGGGMTEYERKRLENIQRNLEFMRSMGVSTAKIAARTATSMPASTTTTRTGISAKRKPTKPLAPQRKSRRLEGQLAEELMLRDERNPFTVEEIQRMKQQQQQANAPLAAARFGANLDAKALNVDATDGQQRLLASILGEDPEEREEREEDLKVDASVLDTISYTLADKDVIKAVEERIYSIAFHPRSDRVVVAIGDKRGHVALWNADASQEQGEEDDKNVVAMYRPHTSPTTQLHFQPNDTSKLLSASFDGSVRQFDLKAATFTELFATEDHTGITSVALTTQPHTVLASGDDGHVWAVDLRQQPASHNAYLVHEKKVQTVHQHPLLDFCFATASLDRTVCLWDIRKLTTTKSNTTQPLVTMPHHRSVNCAYFSPNGAHLVTVGQDDWLHVYDTQEPSHVNVHDVQPTLRIPHNNQTGRWLTKLHASWDPKRPDEYVIGCMQQPRRLQIFNATRKSPIQELTSPLFGSVHSINVFHPSLPLIAGGNSSGRMCLWRGGEGSKHS